MLNLLFISNSSKIMGVRKALQPLLTVIIDVVPNFDHGLKDVFEKRPATVCIQDNIDGVTGESVARHIQMLLGSTAPSFILMHEGNSKARIIKGLFEHLVDLNQSPADLVEDFQRTLKLLLGDQWQKIYIPPKQTAAAMRKSLSVPDESREDADKLVDDFLSDLETKGFSAVDEDGATDGTLPAAPAGEAFIVQSTDDELAEIIQNQSPAAFWEPVSEPAIAANETPAATVAARLPDAPPSAVPPVHVAEEKKLTAEKTLPASQPPGKKRDDKSAEVVEPDIIRPVSAASAPVTTAAVQPPDFTIQRSAVVPAAPFSAEQTENHANGEKSIVHEEQIPEELLQAFEANYRSESFFIKRSVLVLLVLLVCVAAGGWYVFWQNPRMLVSLKQRFKTAPAPSVAPAPTPVPAQVPTATPVVPAAVPAPAPASSEVAGANQQNVPDTRPPSPVPATKPVVKPATLPSVFPRHGRDASYSTEHPGWERYVDKRYDCRIFNSGDTQKAVQILAVKNGKIPGRLIKQVLQEVVGTSDYTIQNRETKAGFLLQRATTKNNADVLLYSKHGAVRALVIDQRLTAAAPGTAKQAAPSVTQPPSVPAPAAKPNAPPSPPHSIIPRHSRDAEYASQHPGWERYVDKKYDYRTFSTGTTLKAVQVLAINKAVIPDSLVKSVLQEVAGESNYAIRSRETKNGLLLQHGGLKDKADLLLYSKNGKLQAFVIELK